MVDDMVVVEHKDLVVVVLQYYNDYYVVVVVVVVENHMKLDWTQMVVEVDVHMDVKVEEVYDQYYYVEEVEVVVVVVVMIDLEVVVVGQAVLVVMDNENVECNYYWHDDEFDNEKMMVDVEMMKNERMRNYEMAPVDDLMMKMMELLLVLV
jgi:hypothetical protein